MASSSSSILFEQKPITGELICSGTDPAVDPITGVPFY